MLERPLLVVNRNYDINAGLGTSRVMQGQTRASAWCQRTIGQLAAIAPADPVNDDYRALMANNAKQFNAQRQMLAQNPLGIVYNYELENSSYGPPGVIAKLSGLCMTAQEQVEKRRHADEGHHHTDRQLHWRDHRACQRIGQCKQGAASEHHQQDDD